MALVVFHDHSDHPLKRFLKRGFRHCCCALQSGAYWILIDAQAGRPTVEVVAPADFDLAAFYESEGFTVVQTQQRADPSGLFVVSNCVGLVKTALALTAPLVVTPWQLYRRLTGGSLLPGKSDHKMPKPTAPAGYMWEPSFVKVFNAKFPHGKWVIDPNWVAEQKETAPVEPDRPETKRPETKPVAPAKLKEGLAEKVVKRRRGAGFLASNRARRDALGTIGQSSGKLGG
jgi:hypothetical protein